MQKTTYSTTVGEKELTVELNDLAENASGSALVRYGDSVVLATVTMSKEDKGTPFFPLTVDYEEKFYAAGQILGSRFIRREGRPSDEATLSARMIDRTIRPLFDHRIRRDVQVVLTVLSIAEDDPDIPGILATSLALGISDIPWDGPVSAVRIGKHHELQELKINPTYEFRHADESEFDLVICGQEQTVNMIEAGANEATESDLLRATELAQSEIDKLQKWQRDIINKAGRSKTELTLPEPTPEMIKLFEEQIEPELDKFVFTGQPGKEGIGELEKKWHQAVEAAEIEDPDNMTDWLFEDRVDKAVHRAAIEKNKRPDGREIGELRPLYAQAGDLSPILHGAGIFYRGGTHILSVLTLGGPGDAQLLDGVEVQNHHKRFMHHYNFPPFSVGETGRIGMNRRSVGHGALAEKALSAVIPPKSEFPYTIRIVSEALSSNGSTSMGAVCGSTLALMDGGVPIKRPVAGIAMGLMQDLEDKERYVVLTDIQGPEDHYGDMDLKVAGTSKGVTAIQMDTKLTGVKFDIIKQAIDQSRAARDKILNTIEQEIPEPRTELSSNAPEILYLQIDPNDIGLVIGPGGKTVNEIKDATGADIDIEEDGGVYITAPKQGGGAQAKQAIEALVKKYEAGEEYTGTVTRIMDFGAFVRIGPNTEGLVHISEIAPWRVDKVTDILKEGDEVPVVIKEIDEKNRINLSIKARDKEFADRALNKK